jgi:glycosyltransferase involved in cell wall biosynthesis
MRILVLTFYFEPDLCAGSFRNTAFISALKDNLTINDKVDIVTTMPNRYSSFLKEALEEEKDENITIKRIKIPKHQSGMVDQVISFTTFALKTFLYLGKKEKYDIVFASSSRLMTAFLGALISNRQKAKLFLDIRDIFTDTMGDIFKKSKLRHMISLFKIIEKYTINSAYHINLVSHGFEEYFLNINPTSKYSFFYNGVDNIFLEYNFKKEINSDKKIITYAGNIGEGQGLEKIIPDMAKLLPEEYEIHIIGDGGRKQQLIDSVTGLENVKLFNSLDRNKLLEIYKNSDFLFLHLNDYDAFKKVLPSKIFEFAATNKYIIAGVSGYAKEFIEKNVTDSIVFNPCDALDFITKFKKIEFSKIDRSEFINQYTRVNIMKNMANKVYNI